jgi:DNA-binding PadR family transcriptional regulator
MPAASPPRSSPLALTVLSLLSYQPLHPYGIRRLIKQWGKEQVVNVGQPASLYRTIERLLEAGLISVLETGRDQRYPERTVYEITSSGREIAKTWLTDMLARPANEFPQFPTALSYLMLLPPDEAAPALATRAASLRKQIEALSADGGVPLPRVTTLDEEYLRAVTEAELTWVEGVAEDLATGRLTWDAAELIALAAGQDRALMDS